MDINNFEIKNVRDIFALNILGQIEGGDLFQ